MVKVNYKNNGYLGDLDLMTKLEQTSEPLQNITELTLDITDLLDLLKNNKHLIENIEYHYNPVLKCKYKDDQTDTFGKILTRWAKDTKVSIDQLDLDSRHTGTGGSKEA